MDATELKKLTVKDLQEKLKEVSLPHTGKKDVLIARLVEHAAASVTTDAAPDAVEEADEEDALLEETNEAATETEPEPENTKTETTTTTEEEKPTSTETETTEEPAATETTTSEPETKDGATKAKTQDEKKAERAKRFGLPVKTESSAGKSKGAKNGKKLTQENGKKTDARRKRSQTSAVGEKSRTLWSCHQANRRFEKATESCKVWSYRQTSQARRRRR